MFPLEQTAERCRELAEASNYSPPVKAAIARLAKHVNHGTQPHVELTNGFASNRSIIIPTAINALVEAEREIAELKQQLRDSVNDTLTWADPDSHA